MAPKKPTKPIRPHTIGAVPNSSASIFSRQQTSVPAVPAPAGTIVRATRPKHPSKVPKKKK